MHVMAANKTHPWSAREISLLVSVANEYQKLSWPAKTDIFNYRSQLQVPGAPTRSAAALTRKYWRLSTGDPAVLIQLGHLSTPAAGPDLVAPPDLRSWDETPQMIQSDVPVPTDEVSALVYDSRSTQARVHDGRQARSDMLPGSHVDMLRGLYTVTDPVSSASGPDPFSMAPGPQLRSNEGQYLIDHGTGIAGTNQAGIDHQLGSLPAQPGVYSAESGRESKSQIVGLGRSEPTPRTRIQPYVGNAEVHPGRDLWESF